MKIKFKRLGAFIIDSIIIVIISTALASIIISPANEKKYSQYNSQASNNYINLIKREISTKEYDKNMKEISYNIEKYGLTYSVVSAVCLIGYYGLYQYINNGRTLGKKLFKIMVRAKDKNKKITINQMILRAVINNSIFVPILSSILVVTLSVNNYYEFYQVVQYAGIFIFTLSVGFIIITKEGRGIHDRLSGTIVINIDKD